MTKVIVVGAGASGLTAAICARKKGLDVTLLERNDILGKKILGTGNGHCNYWNENMNINYYHSKDDKYLEQIITKDNQQKVREFFNYLGVIPKVKNGYYYPYSMQAVSIKAVLENALAELEISLITKTFVQKIEKKDKTFVVYTENKVYESDYVIVATGSKAAPKTGSDGKGYDLISYFNHTIIPVLPSLTQVNGLANYYKEWNGIRIQAKLSLYEDKEFIKDEEGEIHLTDSGISGICTFNLSGLVAKGLNKNKKEIIKINFVPDLPITSIDTGLEFLEERNNLLKNRRIDQLFDGFLPYKLVYLFLHLANIKKEERWDSLNIDQQKKLISLIIEHPLEVKSVGEFSKAQVCSGGVSLQEINLKTMESKLTKGLYIIGELLDVDGDCGGYNLGFAWLSGILAGEAVGENRD